jgi:type IV secretory pathway VirB10-like protein
MRAPLPANSSSPWHRASPHGQNSQRSGNRRVVSFVRTFLIVVACGVLLGYGLAYLFPNFPTPAPGADPNIQTRALAVTADSTADAATAPVSELPIPVVEQPLVKPAQPTLAAATVKQPSAHLKKQRPRATQRVTRPPAARTRVGTWLRKAREKILPHRQKANDSKRKKQKAAPCKCAVNLKGFSSATLTA